MAETIIDLSGNVLVVDEVRATNSGGGGGAVESVNGLTGVVELSAENLPYQEGNETPTVYTIIDSLNTQLVNLVSRVEALENAAE